MKTKLTPIICQISQDQDLLDHQQISKLLTSLKIEPQKAEIQLISKDGASIKIKQIRQLISQASYASYHPKIPRVTILWQAESITIPAQNALLKILEEPPANFLIILVTAYPQSLITTVQSRCQTIQIDLQISSQSATNENFIQQALANSLSFSQTIELTDQIKDRQQAIKFVHELINQIKENESFPSIELINKIQVCQTALVQLKQNLNLNLTLNQMLFDFIQTPKS